MITTPIDWRLLQPDTSGFQAAFNQTYSGNESSLFAIQPRLRAALTQLNHPKNNHPLLIKSLESIEYYQWIATACQLCSDSRNDVSKGWDYELQGNGEYLLLENNTGEANFIQKPGVWQTDWIEHEQLFGCIRKTAKGWKPIPGLLHQANGGTLIITVQTLLMQPLLWQRLKRSVINGFFEWLSPSPDKTLAITLPNLPLSIRLVLCGDRETLAEFALQEPNFTSSALYCEFEEQMLCKTPEQVSQWCQWVVTLAKRADLPVPTPDFWPGMITETSRYSEDQLRWSICPKWITQILRNTVINSGGLEGNALLKSIQQQRWLQNYLPERMQDAIIEDNPLLTTEGSTIGQINGLSVIEYPGHPQPWGEPSRISCVVHFGDGEVMDIERKAELGGNLHAKGMMIIQAYLMSALSLEQQLPFTASMVFEQSYSEIDGDSASLAELCALISALAAAPIAQQYAVTGSVDQFGRLQAVGGLNEKIEGFYKICLARGLTGQQGVIIPSANIRHLTLAKEVVDAVKAGVFQIWAFDHAEQAFPLLMANHWEDTETPGLLTIIQQRISLASQSEDSRSTLTRWFSWYKRH